MKQLWVALRRWFFRTESCGAVPPNVADEPDSHDAPLVARVVHFHVLVQSQELFALVVEGLGTDPLCDVREAIPDLLSMLAVPEFAMFVAYRDTVPVGFALAQNNRGLSSGCLVLHFYVRAGGRARRELRSAVIDFARAGGMTRLLGVDINDSPEAFSRMFRSPELAIVPYGRLFEFRLL